MEPPPPDAHISRCPECGMWRWRGLCPQCSERLAGGLISQNALPPYEMHCWGCGRTWTPTPAAGQSKVTANRCDTLATEHWQACKGQA